MTPEFMHGPASPSIRSLERFYNRRLRCIIQSLRTGLPQLGRPATSAFLPLWVDTVEKVSAKELWNQKMKRTNPGDLIFESRLRIWS